MNYTPYARCPSLADDWRVCRDFDNSPALSSDTLGTIPQGLRRLLGSRRPGRGEWSRPVPARDSSRRWKHTRIPCGHQNPYDCAVCSRSSPTDEDELARQEASRPTDEVRRSDQAGRQDADRSDGRMGGSLPRATGAGGWAISSVQMRADTRTGPSGTVRTVPICQIYAARPCISSTSAVKDLNHVL